MLFRSLAPLVIHDVEAQRLYGNKIGDAGAAAIAEAEGGWISLRTQEGMRFPIILVFCNTALEHYMYPAYFLRDNVLADYNEIGQSAAIERYVARSCDLMGSDPIEAAQIDMWAEHVRELKDKYKVAKASGTEANNLAIEGVFKEGHAIDRPKMPTAPGASTDVVAIVGAAAAMAGVGVNSLPSNPVRHASLFHDVHSAMNNIAQDLRHFRKVAQENDDARSEEMKVCGRN